MHFLVFEFYFFNIHCLKSVVELFLNLFEFEFLVLKFLFFINQLRLLILNFLPEISQVHQLLLEAIPLTLDLYFSFLKDASLFIEFFPLKVHSLLLAK